MYHPGRKGNDRLLFIFILERSLQFRRSLLITIGPPPFLRHSTFGLGGGALVATINSSNTVQQQQQQQQQLAAVQVQVPTNKLFMCDACCRGGSAACTILLLSYLLLQLSLLTLPVEESLPSQRLPLVMLCVICTPGIVVRCCLTHVKLSCERTASSYGSCAAARAASAACCSSSSSSSNSERRTLRMISFHL